MPHMPGHIPEPTQDVMDNLLDEIGMVLTLSAETYADWGNTARILFLFGTEWGERYFQHRIAKRSTDEALTLVEQEFKQMGQDLRQVGEEDEPSKVTGILGNSVGIWTPDS